jgi:hypothetical protein
MNAQRDWHSEPEPEPLEIGQPDPVLQETKAGPLRITLYVIGSVVILGLVLYGLNQPHPEGELTAQQNAANSTAATPAQQPTPSQDEGTKGSGKAAAGNTPAGATTGAASQDGGKQPPQPEPAKPGDKPAAQPNAPGGNQGKPQ